MTDNLSDVPGKWARDFIREKPPKIDWLIEGLMVTGGTTEIYADTGMGKTWLGLQMIAHVIEGTPLFDRFKVTNPGNAILVQAELDESQLRFRLHSMARSYPGMDDPGPWLPAPQIHRITRKPVWDGIVAAVEATEAKLLVLDPLRHMTDTGDMNDERGLARLLADYLDVLRFRYKVHILVIHHARKAHNDPEGSRILSGYQDSGGSRAIIEWAEAIFHMQGDVIDKPDGRQQLVVEKLRSAPRLNNNRISLHFDHEKLLFVPAGTGTLDRRSIALALLKTPLLLADYRKVLEVKLGLSRSVAYRLLTDMTEEGAIVVEDGKCRPAA